MPNSGSMRLRNSWKAAVLVGSTVTVNVVLPPAASAHFKIHMAAQEKVVVYSDTATSVDAEVFGIKDE